MRLTRKKACILLDLTMLLLVAWVTLRIFIMPPQAHYDVDRSVYPMKGIDVSAHNGDIDFMAAHADTVEFVYIKATEGVDFCDARFNINHRGATEAGMKVGAYHFFRFDSPGELQAQHFLSTVGGRTLHLPLAIDVEKWGNPSDYNIDMVKSNLRDMVDAIKEQGYPLVIYTNKHGYERFIAGDFADVPIWICSLSGIPRPKWVLWQHSHIGRVKGVDGKVDIDTYAGPSEDFDRWTDAYHVSSQ